MSERYFVTGVQIGILKCVLDGSLPVSKGLELLKEIEDDQFIGNVRDEKDKIVII